MATKNLDIKLSFPVIFCDPEKMSVTPANRSYGAVPPKSVWYMCRRRCSGFTTLVSWILEPSVAYPAPWPILHARRPNNQESTTLKLIQQQLNYDKYSVRTTARGQRATRPMMPTASKQAQIQLEKNLALFQNPPMFYAGLGVSKGNKMNDAQKAEVMDASLNEFVIEAWIRWLKTRHQFNGSPWLTKQHLGSVRLSGGEFVPCSRPLTSGLSCRDRRGNGKIRLEQRHENRVAEDPDTLNRCSAKFGMNIAI